MSDARKEYEQWSVLVDRQAIGEPLNEEEREFCRAFESRNAQCRAELDAYAQLGDLQGVPDAASRALVEHTLARLEQEDSERAAAEMRMLRRPRASVAWAVASLFVVAGFVGYAVHANRARQHEAAQSSTPLPLARAELVYSSGAVSVSGRSADAGHRLLSEGSVLETGEGTACVLIDSDINVCLAAHSRMRLATIAAAARRVELESGTLATRLAKQPEGMSLSIVAAGVSSTAVGTAYSVELEADRRVVTTVLNGKVRVGHRDDTTIVSAHERAVTGAARPVVTSVSRSEEAPSWALLGPTVLWHDPVAATLEVHGEPAGAETFLDDQSIGVAPLSTLVPVGEHRLVVQRAGHQLHAQRLHLHAGELKTIDYAASQTAAPADELKLSAAARWKAAQRRAAVRDSDALETSEGAHEAEEAEPAELLRQARQAVHEARYLDAAHTYQTLIHRDQKSEDARTALVLLGQLRLARLNDPRGALKALDAYLRSPGSLEVEARVARIEALRRLHRTPEEVEAIEDFLAHHSRSFEAKALRARLTALKDSR